MSADEAKDFLLEERSFVNINLPSYFTFKELLQTIDKTILNKSLKQICFKKKNDLGYEKIYYPSGFEEVNYSFIDNKDGRYSWRPLEIIHPVLYVHLIHIITLEKNWKTILDRFETLQSNPKIECYSLPTKSEEEGQTNTAATILKWWSKIEQQSIELSLRYDYVIHTDITDCYGSIYTHSIPWALHSKEVSKKKRNDNKLVGNVIDKTIQGMRYGQTNGIPQGSVLMNLIAEIVLGYADLLLSETIPSHIVDYKIIRYRDDYRIFTNSQKDAEVIMKHLTEVLITLGMRLGAKKTMASNDIVRSSIKPDKLFWNKQKQFNKSFQKNLLLINELSHEHPNSGSLFKSLNRFYKRLSKFNKSLKDTTALISIVVDISIRNPRVYSVSAAIISNLLNDFEKEKRKNIIDQVLRKFDSIPNIGHLEVWLQRVTIKTDRQRSYEELLCQKVNKPDLLLWNCDWLSDDIKETMKITNLIDEKMIATLNTVISPKEVDDFHYEYKK